MASRRPTGTKQQEEVMGKAVPEQHPAVVLRSHYNHLRALLIAALIAVLGLAGAVVIVANDDDTVVSTSTPAIEYGGTGATGVPDTAPLPQRRLDGAVDTAPAPRYDGGPNEGSADITPGVNLPARPNQAQAFPGTAQQAEASVSRHDIRMDLRRLQAGGVTSQGSADVTTGFLPRSAPVAPQTGSPRYDGGPNEGSADIQFRGSKASANPQTDSPGYDGGPVSRYEGEAEHFVVPASP
jgi:hypothetical protein